ncbi:MAG TPA: class F sortase [Marmoricola sp.]
MSATARRRTAQVAALVAALIVLVWILLRPHPLADAGTPPPVRQSVTAGSVLDPKPCYRGATEPFTPKRITVPGIVRDAEVLALPRDAANVPSAPPISDVGKTQFAWSIPPDPMPGDPKGNTLLNAHTWPDGTALGNKLLDGLQVGGRVILHGRAADGTPQTLCYQVTKRDVIVASDGSFEYYESEGPPQIAIIVCSPPRLGPGNWLHRTIWYASPLQS